MTTHKKLKNIFRKGPAERPSPKEQQPLINKLFTKCDQYIQELAEDYKKGSSKKQFLAIKMRDCLTASEQSQSTRLEKFQEAFKEYKKYVGKLNQETDNFSAHIQSTLNNPITCTLGLLLNVCDVSYNHKCEFQKSQQLEIVMTLPDESGPMFCATSFSERKKAIENDGYQITEARGPKRLGGGFQMNSPQVTALGYVVAAPKDSNEPIVLAFRGTISDSIEIDDLAADARLTAVGTLGRQYRDEAYDIYLKVREKYPDKQIVITGHSLGGHIAQYVAAKAMDTTEERNILVRTFGSAEIKNKHEKALPDNLRRKFVNYRSENDPVSKVGDRVGTTITLPSKHISLVKTHGIPGLRKCFPTTLLHHELEQSNLSQLKEKVMTAHFIYQMKGNKFTRDIYEKKLNLICKYMKRIQEIIEMLQSQNEKLERIKVVLDNLEENLKGLNKNGQLNDKHTSTLILRALQNEIQEIQEIQEIKKQITHESAPEKLTNESREKHRTQPNAKLRFR